MRMEGRVRRSRGSLEWQTAQSHPIIGTPWDVPVPRRVILRFNDPLAAALRLDVPEAQLVEYLLEDLALLGRQIAARLHLKHLENVDHLRSAFEVWLDALTGTRILEIAEVDGGRAGQRHHECREGKLWGLGFVSH